MLGNGTSCGTGINELVNGTKVREFSYSHDSHARTIPMPNVAAQFSCSHESHAPTIPIMGIVLADFGDRIFGDRIWCQSLVECSA